MKLMAWGSNYYGQIGAYIHPVKIIKETPTGSDWVQVSTGSICTHGIKSDGTLWGCGDGGNGALGTGTITDVTEFIQIGTDSDWVKVIVGDMCAFGIKVGGTLWAWGYSGPYSWLGLNSTANFLFPTQVGSSTLWADISIGTNHIIGLQSNGTVWAWGKNTSYELGLGDITNRLVPTYISTISGVTKISAGGSHTLCIKSDGTLYGFGRNNYYQLGISGSIANVQTPTQLGADSDWMDIAAGAIHSILLKTNTAMYSCGSNTDGQLGLGDTTQRTSFTLIGETWTKLRGGPGFSNASFAIDTDGVLYGWGSNTNYVLNTGTTVDKLSPTLIGEGFSDWSSISEYGGVVALLNLENDFWTNFSGQTEIHL